MDSRTSRRRLLRGAAAAGAIAAIGGPAPLAGAAATRGSGRVKLLFQAYIGVGSATTSVELFTRAVQPWVRSHPGVDLTIVAEPDLTTTISSILAGGGPDVYHSWQPDSVFSNPAFAENLSPYVKKYNADLSVFNLAQLAVFQQPRGLLALPYYLGTYAAAVNVGMFDQAGIKYPSSDWTYREYSDLARSLTKKSPDASRRVYGGSIGIGWMGSPPNDQATDPFVPPFIAWGFGNGGYAAPGNPSRCIADSPGTTKAMEWAYSLVNDGAMGNAWAFFNFPTSQVAMAPAPGFKLPIAASSFAGIKYDFFPMPSFPQGLATGATEDMNVMNPNSKHKDVAWDFMHWLAFETVWQKALMQIELLCPCLTSLWDDWVQVVQAVAPPLRGKNIAVFADMAKTNRAYPKQVFTYESGQANLILGSWGNKIAAKQVSVIDGLHQATVQVNALESNGAATQAAAIARVDNLEKYLKRATASATAITYPAPPRDDGGVAATAAPKLVQFNRATGAYTLRGAGSGINAHANDAETFAASAFRLSRGEFTCRLTAISALGASSIPTAAKVGLMARSSLGDSAAFVAAVVAMGRGVHLQTRPVALVGGGDETSGGSMLDMTGVIADNGSPAKNYVLKPLWLRLKLDGNLWTPYTSLDGKAWTAGNSPVSVEALGCWVGLCVTSHQSGTYISATFDHLVGFTPNTFVQVGLP